MSLEEFRTSTPRRRRFAAALTLVLSALPALTGVGTAQDGVLESPIGRELAIGREVAIQHHLRDDEEFRIPLAALIAYGKQLFCANWTDQDGGGRPLTKGTGKQLTNVTAPLTGARSFNRISGPDANSCAGCHNAPYGMAGGAGDIVSNVFVLAQRFDFVDFDRRNGLATAGAVDERNRLVDLESVGNSRATTHLFGAGYIEMLARQMTAELQAIRNTVSVGHARPLLAKGISFGTIARTADGLWETSGVTGLPWPSLVSHGSNDPPTLIVRPWHQAGNVSSIREFTNTAYNQHHGIQSTERFGVDTDADGDGIANELSRAAITAATLFQTTLQVPGRVIPRDPAVERAVLLGERTFERIACPACHVPSLPLTEDAWVFVEPSPYNPPGNLRSGETRSLRVDLNDKSLPAPRLSLNERRRVVDVPAYTDLKLHDITDPSDNRYRGARHEPRHVVAEVHRGQPPVLTKRLWGAASAPTHFHHGLFTTLRQAILAHAGEALASRRAFDALPADRQDAVIEFLKTLQVLPPGTKDRIVDERFRARSWPPMDAPAEHSEGAK